MLKTLMHPTPAGNARNEAGRPAPSSPVPARALDADKPAETSRMPQSDEGSKLIVGPNIKLKGSEITDCEILVVEGRVEASMNSRDIRIAEGGVFSGRAEIDVAEVRGTFEGDLIARKRLVVYATGRVNGTIRYGAMMVEEGGIIAGNVAMHEPAPAQSRTQGMPQASETETADASNLEHLPSARSLAGGRAA